MGYTDILSAMMFVVSVYFLLVVINILKVIAEMLFDKTIYNDPLRVELTLRDLLIVGLKICVIYPSIMVLLFVFSRKSYSSFSAYLISLTDHELPSGLEWLNWPINIALFAFILYASSFLVIRIRKIWKRLESLDRTIPHGMSYGDENGPSEPEDT